MKRNNNSGKGKAGLLSVVFLIVFILSAGQMFAQPEVQKPARILFLVDASSSMTGEWTPTETRFKAAARVISALVDSIHNVNSDVAFAVRVFGNQHTAQEKNCFDSKLEVPFNLANDAQIKLRLKYLTPLGYSPIAWSLKETAENDFTQSDDYSYSIILVTDGGESCGGDICATVKNLLEKKISFKPYILSMIEDPTLKLQYECLGRYLTVAKEKDIEPAIKTIINDNRKILTIKNTGLHALKTNVPKAEPTVGKPVTPVIVKKDTPEPVKKEEPKPPVKPDPVVVKKDPVSPPVKKEEPRPILKPDPVVVKKDPVVPPVKKEEPKPVIPEEKPVIRVKLTSMDRIASLTKPRKMNLLYTLADGEPVSVPKLSNIIIIKEDEVPVPASRPTPKPQGVIEPVSPTPRPKVTTTATPVKKEAKKTADKLEFDVTTEEARESTLQIYFTNGQGRFYNTEPKMVIKDSKTGKEVKSLYRNVVAGQPTPIKLDPGTYDIDIPGGRAKASGIVVEAGKNKKYYIKIGNSSLAFYYPAAPDRPVKEFTALVSKRFEPGPVVKQKCDTELPYEPTNYHIEINTLPPMILNVDLEVNNVKLISMSETGQVQITNQSSMGKVQFWYQHGDTYVPFYEMMVNGDPSKQKVDFLPGLYQVRFYTGPVTPLAKADVIMFRVKSNMTTPIELQK